MNKYLFIVSIEYRGDRQTALNRLRFATQEGLCAITENRFDLEESNKNDIGKADITITCESES